MLYLKKKKQKKKNFDGKLFRYIEPIKEKSFFLDFYELLVRHYFRFKNYITIQKLKKIEINNMLKSTECRLEEYFKEKERSKEVDGKLSLYNKLVLKLNKFITKPLILSGFRQDYKKGPLLADGSLAKYVYNSFTRNDINYIDRVSLGLLTNKEMSHLRKLLKKNKLSNKKKIYFINELDKLNIFCKRLRIMDRDDAIKLIGKKLTIEELNRYSQYLEELRELFNLDTKEEVENFFYGFVDKKKYLKNILYFD